MIHKSFTNIRFCVIHRYNNANFWDFHICLLITFLNYKANIAQSFNKKELILRIFSRNSIIINLKLKTKVMKEDLEKEMKEVQSEIDFHTKNLHKSLTRQKELSKKIGRSKKTISLEWTVSPHLFFSYH